MLFFLKDLFIFFLCELFIGIIFIVFLVFLGFVVGLLLWIPEVLNNEDESGR